VENAGALGQLAIVLLLSGRPALRHFSGGSADQVNAAPVARFQIGIFSAALDVAPGLLLILGYGCAA